MDAPHFELALHPSFPSSPYAPHTYTKPGRYVLDVKVVDIFGNDTTTLLPVPVG